MYREWLSFQPHRRVWDRWFMMGSIGITVGLTGYLLYTCIEVLAQFKLNSQRFLLRKVRLLCAMHLGSTPTNR